MKFTPLRKSINLILFFVVFGFLISGFDFEETIQLISSKFLIILLVALVIRSYRNYEIVIDPYRIQLKKIFGSSISLELDSISKIEFESNKYPRANWDMLYLYSGERIYEYNITSFNKRKLLNALVEICEINGIAIDTAKLKLSRFELI